MTTMRPLWYTVADRRPETYGRIMEPVRKEK